MLLWVTTGLVQLKWKESYHILWQRHCNNIYETFITSACIQNFVHYVLQRLGICPKLYHVKVNLFVRFMQSRYLMLHISSNRRIVIILNQIGSTITRCYKIETLKYSRYACYIFQCNVKKSAL